MELTCEVCKREGQPTDKENWYGFGDKHYCKVCAQNIPVIAKVINPTATGKDQDEEVIISGVRLGHK